MDNKPFEIYQVEDFIVDESFANYYFNLNVQDRIFWEQWLIKHPSKKIMAIEAGEMIRSLSLALNEKEYEQEHKKIQTAINAIDIKKPYQLFRFLNPNKISTPVSRKKRMAQYFVAGLLILSAGATYFITRSSDISTVQLNKTITSGNNIVEFTLNDSTVVTLAPNSSLHYPVKFLGQNRQVYLEGEAGFNVKRNEQFPFKVHSKNIVTTVLGTVFNIKKQADSAIVVQLFKGRLKVEIEDATMASLPPILLYPDEKATYVFNNKNFYKEASPAVSDVSFRQASFEEIAARIKNEFGKTVVNNSDKKTWRFTGEFKKLTAQEIIENICLIRNLTSKMFGDTIFINNQ